jgi:hypothetical protein
MACGAETLDQSPKVRKVKRKSTTEAFVPLQRTARAVFANVPGLRNPIDASARMYKGVSEYLSVICKAGEKDDQADNLSHTASHS